jgi:serpin B
MRSKIRWRARTAAALLAAMLLLGGIAALGVGAAGRPSPVARSPAAPLSPGKASEVFGLALMRHLPKGNLAFSPDSVLAALAMAGTGASGNTATQIAKALHLGAASRFPTAGQLQRSILDEQAALAHGSSEAPVLNIADGLFVQQGLALEAPFASGLAQSFGATPQTVDFATPGGVEALNAWIAQQTKGLIPQIAAELPRRTRLLLANALFLKAKWSTWFKLRETTPGRFRGVGGSVSTDFMHKTEPLRYSRGHGYDAVSLPYRDSTLSLLVVLPRRESLPVLERQLDAGSLDRLVHSLRQRAVALSLPRFHLQTKATLNAPLEAVGIRDAFSEGADFSRITKAEPLRIGEVLHAADFKVDEEGTEAAAATVVQAEPTSATRYESVVKFTADHPFLFFLRDDRSGAVLFAGRLVQPQD